MLQWLQCHSDRAVGIFGAEAAFRLICERLRAPARRRQGHFRCQRRRPEDWVRFPSQRRIQAKPLRAIPLEDRLPWKNGLPTRLPEFRKVSVDEAVRDSFGFSRAETRRSEHQLRAKAPRFPDHCIDIVRGRGAVKRRISSLPPQFPLDRWLTNLDYLSSAKSTAAGSRISVGVFVTDGFRFDELMPEASWRSDPP